MWEDTLRTEKNVRNYYEDKFVEKIVKNNEGFSLKGKDKLQREMEWIEQKDRAGYTFAFMSGDNQRESVNNRLSKDDKTVMGKEDNLRDSQVNRSVINNRSELM